MINLIFVEKSLESGLGQALILKPSDLVKNTFLRKT